MELKSAVYVVPVFSLSRIVGCGDSGGEETPRRRGLPLELENAGIKSSLFDPATGTFAPQKLAKRKAKAVKPAPTKPAS